MRKMKRFWSVLLTMVLALTMYVPAMAAVTDTGFSDVAANAWYADAAQYVREEGIMNGTMATEFQPNGTMTRAMLAAVLYRAAGSPAVSTAAEFRDVAANAYYANAVAWASANGIITGYGDGLFGAQDAVTREQIAAILWRYQGSPADDETADSFADYAAISAYAVNAVAWAKEDGIVSGLEGNRFAPKENATRAQVALILMHLLQGEQLDRTPETPDAERKVLVVYFSATGNTEAVAKRLQTVLAADSYEIVPEEPYTADDLNYNNDDCRANKEQNDSTARPAISGSVENMSDYDVVFVGYPIWWGKAPKIIETFLESYDFSGKTVIPFCTSGSSDIVGSLNEIKSAAPDADWKEGRRFSANVTETDLQAWVNGLGLN